MHRSLICLVASELRAYLTLSWRTDVRVAAQAVTRLNDSRAPVVHRNRVHRCRM